MIKFIIKIIALSTLVFIGHIRTCHAQLLPPGISLPAGVTVEMAEMYLKSASSLNSLPKSVEASGINTISGNQNRDQLTVVAPAPHGKIFGSQLFGGTFRGTLNPGFNPEYRITIGDRLLIRLWGGINMESAFTVDPQGNIFIPNVGPIALSGVASGELNRIVERAIRKVYKDGTFVYAALDVSQPVKVFVTGFVRQPGLYGGVASDSPLSYIDKAGGVDQERGSYVEIQIKRGQAIRKKLNLYDFLMDGTLDLVQFQDGDVIVILPRKHSFSIAGEVFNSYDFEFSASQISLKTALEMAKVKPGATHISIVRKQGSEKRTEYYSLSSIDQVTLNDGDLVNVTADRYPGTIQVRIEGAHSGEHALVLPYGATLKDVLSKIRANSMSRLDAIQIFRTSVANRQKEMLLVSLQKLEEAVLSARSSSSEEANLRAREAELVLKFVDRARNIQPKGQIVLGEVQQETTFLEDGDLIVIPERTSLVIVHGEVLFPNAVSWQNGLTALDYIDLVGGFTQGADTSKIIKIRKNGATLLANSSTPIAAGDEVMVLPKIETKSIEVTRSLTQILYQIAFTAKVAFGL